MLLYPAMEAGTSGLNQHRQPGPSSCSDPRVTSEDQTHHKPFFYVQPPQPFVPVQGLQWPSPLAQYMPFNYNPYYGGGYPGFGYGLPLMPHFQPSPFMEAPGFVVPHTHLHHMDYRRMLNPQYYQSMAYHARRLRYQPNGPQRDVTSSEVQTEPFPASQSHNRQSSDTSPNLPTALSVQNDRTQALKELASSSTNATPKKGSFVLETEELRIRCCATPASLQVLHSNETSEMFAQDVVHCSSIVQNSLLPEISEAVTREENTPQPRQACPDILIVANEKNLQAETTRSIHARTGIDADAETVPNHKDLKVMHLPFDAQYLDELQKTESTVWSTEDTLVPSPDFIDSCEETLHGDISIAEMPDTRAEIGQEELVPTALGQKSITEDFGDIAPTLEHPSDKMVHVEIPLLGSFSDKLDFKKSQDHLLSDDSAMDGAMHDTSFESLPAYLPSASWFAEFDNPCYLKIPATPQKLKQMGSRSLDVQARRRKLDMEFKELTAIRKPRECFKPKPGKTERKCLSDHECCISQSYNENSLISYVAKARRLCVRCSSKHQVQELLSSPAELSKHKFSSIQPHKEFILPRCDTCKSHRNKRFARRGFGPDARTETEGESLENGSRRKLMEEMVRPLVMKQNVERCPVTYAKLRERNCQCGELHQQQFQSKWHRTFHCPHGNTARERDENHVSSLSPESWRTKEQLYLSHRWQTGKPWKTAAGHNMESFKNDLIRAQRTNLHKKTLPPPQGIHRKDTRC